MSKLSAPFALKKLNEVNLGCWKRRQESGHDIEQISGR